MKPKPEVVEGLRELFIKGATYSGLLRYILNHHGGEVPRQLVYSYWHVAFSSALFQPIKKEVGCKANDEYYSQLTSRLIPEIIRNGETWITDAESETWWNDLEMDSSPVCESEKPTWMSTESWDSLTDAERQQLAQTIQNGEIQYQQKRLLARLAEQLQRQLSELEAANSTDDVSAR